MIFTFDVDIFPLYKERRTDIYAEVRSLQNLHFQTQVRLTRIKNRLARWFFVYFPEYENISEDIKAVRRWMVLKAAPLPEDIIKLGGRCEPDLKGHKAEGSWNEESKGPGIGCRA